MTIVCCKVYFQLKIKTLKKFLVSLTYLQNFVSSEAKCVKHSRLPIIKVNYLRVVSQKTKNVKMSLLSMCTPLGSIQHQLIKSDSKSCLEMIGEHVNCKIVSVGLLHLHKINQQIKLFAIGKIGATQLTLDALTNHQGSRVSITPPQKATCKTH